MHTVKYIVNFLFVYTVRLRLSVTYSVADVVCSTLMPNTINATSSFLLAALKKMLLNDFQNLA